MSAPSRLAIVGIALALGLTGCTGQSNTAEPTTGSTNEPATGSTNEGATTADAQAEPAAVHVAADSFLLGTQAWVARDQGYFAEQGLEAEVSMFGTGIEAIQGVIARQAEVGHALDFAVLNLVAAADENMSIIGAIAQPAPGFHSLAVNDQITEASDLVGKRIGYVEGTSEHFVTITHLADHGITPDQVELVNLPGLFELVGALRTGEVDAAWTWLDGTQQAEEDPNLSILTDDSDVLDTVAIYLIAETQWAADNQDTIERLLRAYDQASGFIAEDPTGTAQIVAEATGGDAAVFEGVIPNQNYQVGFTPTMLESLEAISQFLIDSGVLEPNFEVAEFLQLDAMRAAVPGSVTADVS